jgi:hypothetical protein
VDPSTDVLVLRAPGRHRVVGLLILATLVAVVVGLAFVAPAPAVVALVLIGPVAWPLLPAILSSRTARLGPDGVRTRVYPWDRRPIRVPWTDVSTAWIASVGRYRYLHLGLRDPARYVTGGPMRRMVLQGLVDANGTPVLVHLPDGMDGPALARVTSAAVPVGDARPQRTESPAPEEHESPVPRRTYRASPRNLVLPAVLLLGSAGLAALSFVAGLLSVASLAAYLFAFAVFAAIRLRGRTVLDGSGFTVDGRPVPWSDISEVRFVTVGPFRSVRLLRPPYGVLIARGLVDQPVADPRYAGRVDEVAAACADRVPAGPRRDSALLTALFPLVLVAMLTLTQFAMMDRPWRDSPWWPGLALATSTADPCRPLSTDAAARLVPDAGPEAVYGAESKPGRLCRLDNRLASLEVTLTRATYGDLLAQAREEFRRSSDDGEPLPGLGDEARVGGSSALAVEVVARRGNVVVEVRFRGDSGSGPVTATHRSDAIEVARRAVDTVTLR